MTSEKTDKSEFGGFKIPLKRRRLQSEAESSDSSDGCETAVSSMPEAPTTSKSWGYASQKPDGVFSDYQGRLKLRRRGLIAHQRRKQKAPERVEVRDSDLVAEQHPSRDSKSVESIESPRDFESMARMMSEMRLTTRELYPERTAGPYSCT